MESGTSQIVRRVRNLARSFDHMFDREDVQYIQDMHDKRVALTSMSRICGMNDIMNFQTSCAQRAASHTFNMYVHACSYGKYSFIL